MQISDALDRVIFIDSVPQRIISLVPSLTELLFDLGLDNEIVGVTKFCTRPAVAKTNKVQVGGTKKFDFEKIHSLQPDLIIANKEENYKEGVEKLMSQYPVYVSDIFNLDDAIHTLEAIGKMTGTYESALSMGQMIRSRYADIRSSKKGKVLYFIWQSPDMVAGTDNFIDFTLKWLGFENCAGDRTRYPELDANELSEMSPDYVMLSSEPYPFKEKHIERFQAIFPDSKILLVDGEMFSWYGSRLLLAPDYLADLSSNL